MDITSSKDDGNYWVHLDYTLASLYASHDAEDEVLLVPMFPTSCIDLTPEISINKNHPLFESSQSNQSHNEPSQNALRQTLRLKRLTDFVHNQIFTAGPMTVLLVDPHLKPPNDTTTNTTPLSSREYAESQIGKILAVLRPDQRPRLQWVSDFRKLCLRRNQVLAPIMALDDLSNQPCIIPPDLHYEIASKEALALSGLDTPASEVITFEEILPSAAECCSICLNDRDPVIISPTCTGPRARLLHQQTTTSLQKIRAKALPFVLKFTQAVGGTGTFIVRTPAERTSTIPFIEKDYLPTHLPLLTLENIALRPINIILQDFHQGPTLAVSFFVHRNGTYTFICCTEQSLDEQNRWAGSRIFYSHQETLQERMQIIIERTTQYVRRKGYYGPVGIDVIDSSSSTGTEDGALYIVDLNPRLPSSAPLGSLRPHFLSRNLDCATLLLTQIRNLNREDFLGKMDVEVEGSIVIIGWYEYRDEWGSLVSNARIVIGGRDGEDVEIAVQKVRALAD